jgi:phenylalanyl-tRNA synthetase beta chain
VAFAAVPSALPYLHPGRSAAVVAGDELQLGWLGELHPRVAAAWDLGRTAAFAVDLGKVAALAPPVRQFAAFGPFPPLRQDIAVTLPDDVPAAQLLALVREAAGEELEDARVFDVYTGAQVGEGRRSLALALSFRALDRTLTDEDVAPRRERIVAALTSIGGELRG